MSEHIHIMRSQPSYALSDFERRAPSSGLVVTQWQRLKLNSSPNMRLSGKKGEPLLPPAAGRWLPDAHVQLPKGSLWLLSQLPDHLSPVAMHG